MKKYRTNTPKPMEVFKLQRPVYCEDATQANKILIYNKSRSIYGEMFMDWKDITELFEDKYKLYVLGRFQNSNLVIEKILETQNW